MNETDRKILHFLFQLGITGEEGRVYLALIRHGALTTLVLSRQTGINRTRCYRILETLKSKGLIEEVVDEYRRLAKAVEINKIELLIKQEERKVKELHEFFPAVSSLLYGNEHISQPDTQVLFYRGKERIKQQVWNTLQAKGEAVGYSYRPLYDLIGDLYYDWRNEWAKRKIIFRDIYSDEYKKARKTVKIDSVKNPMPHFISRYIPSSILNIDYQIDIYNDVISLYNWYESEVFGVEIHNRKMVSLQKQLFEIVWKMAK